MAKEKLDEVAESAVSIQRLAAICRISKSTAEHMATEKTFARVPGQPGQYLLNDSVGNYIGGTTSGASAK